MKLCIDVQIHFSLIYNQSVNFHVIEFHLQQSQSETRWGFFVISGRANSITAVSFKKCTKRHWAAAAVVLIFTSWVNILSFHFWMLWKSRPMSFTWSDKHVHSNLSETFLLFLYFSSFFCPFAFLLSVWTLHPMAALLTLSQLYLPTWLAQRLIHTLVHLPCIQTHTRTYEHVAEICFFVTFIDGRQTVRDAKVI